MDRTQNAVARAQDTKALIPLSPLQGRGNQPFRFLSLPPELRNSIYAYATKDPNPNRACLRLRHLKPPPITRVSRQLRTESLPVFFTVNTILVETTAPYTGHGTNDIPVDHPAFLSRKDPRWKQTGTLQLPPVVDKILGDAKKLGVRMPKVRIRVSNLISLYAGGDGDGGSILFMGLLRRDREVKIIATPAGDEGAGRRRFEKHLAYLSAPMRKYMLMVRSKTGWVGFSIRDFRLLACMVRRAPREGARACLQKAGGCNV